MYRTNQIPIKEISFAYRATKLKIVCAKWMEVENPIKSIDFSTTTTKKKKQNNKASGSKFIIWKSNAQQTFNNNFNCDFINTMQYMQCKMHYHDSVLLWYYDYK